MTILSSTQSSTIHVSETDSAFNQNPALHLLIHETQNLILASKNTLTKFKPGFDPKLANEVVGSFAGLSSRINWIMAISEESTADQSIALPRQLQTIFSSYEASQRRLVIQSPSHIKLTPHICGLQLIFSTLINNFFRHAVSANVLSISIQPRNFTVQFTFQDNGEGFCLERLQRRLNSRSGLACAQRLVSRYSGTFEIKPPNDTGACIEFSLPRKYFNL